ncbi:protein roadkill-like [Octopus sinensis]|uniref:Protein roadkill-like n=1 Tax=Octopus sinensis TaxID=2607531 RepID=A0A7E6EGV2_9MOLL|nr:protein roadkill-like [Octopus sinensis]
MAFNGSSAVTAAAVVAAVVAAVTTTTSTITTTTTTTTTTTITSAAIATTTTHPLLLSTVRNNSLLMDNSRDTRVPLNGEGVPATGIVQSGEPTSTMSNSDAGYGLRHPWWPAVSVAISMTVFLCISFMRHHRKFQQKRRALIEYMEYELLRNASFSAGSLPSPSTRPATPHGEVSPRGVPTHIPSHHHTSSSSSTSAAGHGDGASHQHHHHHHHHHNQQQKDSHQHNNHHTSSHHHHHASENLASVANSSERKRFGNVKHNGPSQQVALNGYPSKFIQRFLQPNVFPASGFESTSNFTESTCCELSKDFCDHPLDRKGSVQTGFQSRKGSRKYQQTRSRNDDKSGVYLDGLAKSPEHWTT